MKLSEEDNKEIDDIISKLTEGDREIIHDEIERLAEKRNPFFSAIRNHEDDEFTKTACEWLEESEPDYQQLLDRMFWDALTYRVTREYAINIWRNKHSYYEVA